jgi:hypothetical protein
MNKKREMRFEDARDIRTLYGWVKGRLLALEGDCYDDIDAWRSMCFNILHAIEILETTTTKDYPPKDTAPSVFWCEKSGKIVMNKK